jgi:hypothetical protein
MHSKIADFLLSPQAVITEQKESSDFFGTTRNLGMKLFSNNKEESAAKIT